MITLTGTLRQFTTTEWEGKKKTKLWLEHTSARDNGPADLKLEELFLEGDITAQLPKSGSSLTVEVRPYVSGKSIRFSAVGIPPLSGATPGKVAA